VGRRVKPPLQLGEKGGEFDLAKGLSRGNTAAATGTKIRMREERREEGKQNVATLLGQERLNH